MVRLSRRYFNLVVNVITLAINNTIAICCNSPAVKLIQAIRAVIVNKLNIA